MNAGITALATYLPARAVPNHELEAQLDTSDEWIRSRTGITTRHLAADDETTATLAINATRNLIAAHGEAVLDDVDLVIVATATPDAYFPSTAALVQGHFGLTAAAFDLSAACAGWVYALNVASAQIQAGTSRKALVIGAETLSRVTNWEDRTTAVLFGDGAGAAIIEPVPAPFGFKGSAWGADGQGARHLHVGAHAKALPTGEPLTPYIVQNGREVFKFATRAVPEGIHAALTRAGLGLDDVARIVPHQANARIIEAAAQRLGCDPDKFIVSLHEHANNSAATVPLALHYAAREGLVREGDHLVLIGFGGGFSWASCVLTWGALTKPPTNVTAGTDATTTA